MAGVVEGAAWQGTPSVAGDLPGIRVAQLAARGKPLTPAPQGAGPGKRAARHNLRQQIPQHD